MIRNLERVHAISNNNLCIPQALQVVQYATIPKYPTQDPCSLASVDMDRNWCNNDDKAFCCGCLDIHGI